MEDGKFKKGHSPWNKDSVGIMKANRTSFQKGQPSCRKKERVLKVCPECMGVFSVIPSLVRIECCGKKCSQILRIKRKGHPNWIEDRTKLKTGRNHAYDYRYRCWMKDVKNRDGWKCKIANPDCDGRLEAHHILSWREHKELRYNINNGITLCHFHHPRKVEDEKRLQSEFQTLVSVSKV